MVLDKKIYITKNSEETKKLGFNFAKTLRKGDVVCLYGDLGFGKTTFVQGLAEGLGIKKRIISPTFIIVRCYELQTSNFKLKTQNYSSKLKSLERFYHVDLYRIGSERDIEGLGLEEIINDKNNIVVIEWAERLRSLMPAKRVDVEFSYEEENIRKVTFSLTT